jgi:hypothetical protein
MRLSRALLAPVLLLLFVVACGSPAATDGDNGNGNGDEAEQSQAAEETPADDDGGGGGDDGGGGGNAGDAEAAFERLTPPNAEEVTKTTASGVIFAAFNSPDSLDSLTSFYEDAFDDLGLQVISTTEAAGGITWFIGTDENASEFGGVVSVIPAQDGSSGSTISIQIGATNQ